MVPAVAKTPTWRLCVTLPRSQDADVAAVRHASDALHRRAYHSQHPACRIPSRQVVLLNAAQGFGRGRVTGQDDQLAPHLEQLENSLAGELVHNLEGTRSVGRTGIVAQINVIVLGKRLTYLAKNGQAAVAGIEHPDRAGQRREWLHEG